MGKIAFVFAGQGCQHPGMGQSLAQGSRAAAAVFDQLQSVQPDIAQMCFLGTEADLMQTKNTQPCLFAVELAAAAALKEAGIDADMVAGFSLGEVAALTYAGTFSLLDGFRAVRVRGMLMQAAAEQNPAAMAAVLKLDAQTVETVCQRFQSVYPVNYNCPGQIAVAGAQDEMDAFRQEIRAAGGKSILLKVSGGFHSPFMASASEAFGRALEEYSCKTPALTVYANRTAQPYGSDVRTLLTEQIASPVRWEESVRNMIAAGADTFIELGPGTTLCGLIGKIDRQVRCLHVEDMDSLTAVKEEMNPC